MKRFNLIFCASMMLGTVACIKDVPTDDTASSDTGESDTDTDTDLDISQDCTGDTSNLCALQTGSYAIDDAVTVTGLLAHDASTYGFYMVAPDGGAWRGVWVYTSSANTQEGVLSAGDDVSVSGIYKEFDFSGQGAGLTLTELEAVEPENIVLNSSGNAVPEPMVVTATDLADEANAAALESTLVRIESVTVTNAAPDNYKNWIVEGTQYVGPTFLSGPEGLADGDTFDAIQGVFANHYGFHKIFPRDESDLEGWSGSAQ